MTGKLTLSLDTTVIDFAHAFSKRTNRPVSQIVENYFIALRDNSTPANSPALSKDLQGLYGIFEGIDVPDKKELRRMFHEKNSN